MDAWKAQFPGAEEILFLSDGNGDFVKACGLEESCKGLFLGECSRRYAIQMQDTIVISLAIEDSILTVECTGALDQIAAADGDDAPIIEFVEG
jgi:peroxiredoxin